MTVMIFVTSKEWWIATYDDDYYDYDEDDVDDVVDDDDDDYGNDSNDILDQQGVVGWWTLLGNPHLQSPLTLPAACHMNRQIH